MTEKRTLNTLQSDEQFRLSAFQLNYLPHHNIGIFGDIYPKKYTGNIFIAEPLTFIEHKNESAEISPMCTLDNSQAQQLMDSLWTCGIRPVAGAGSVGQLGAVQYHLEDMRKLVFDKFPHPSIRSNPEEPKF